MEKHRKFNKKKMDIFEIEGIRKLILITNNFNVFLKYMKLYSLIDYLLTLKNDYLMLNDGNI